MKLPQHIHWKPVMPSSRPFFITCTLAASAFALAITLPSTARAEEPGNSTWGLGVVAISTQKAYAGIGRESTGFPLVFFENKWVRVFGPGVEFKLATADITATQKLDFRLLVKYDGSGYEADDAPILGGMEKRKGGFWAGGKVTWRNSLVDVSAEVLADASGHSKGKRASLALEKSWRLGDRVLLAPRASAAWVSSEYVDYYYGVRTNEASAARSPYLGQAALNAEVGARATYLIN
ncbi:MipA/OmpV family protein, partial [Roseateles sp. P5_E11]